MHILLSKVSTILFCSFAFISAAFISAATASTELKRIPATKSDRAATSLLLGVSRAGDRLVAVGERGHILYSDDSGKSWHQAEVPVRQVLTNVYFTSPEKGWAVGHDALILTTEDGGATWRIQYDGIAAAGGLVGGEDGAIVDPLMDIVVTPDKEGIAVGAYGKILRTQNGGESWEDWSANVENLDELHYSAVTSTASGVLFIAGELGTLYRSMDSGQSWQPLVSPYEGSFFGVTGTAKAGEVFAFGLKGNVFYSADLGDTWEKVTAGVETSLNGSALLESGKLVFVGQSGVVVAGSQSSSFEATRIKNGLWLSDVSEAPNGDLIMTGLGGVQTIPGKLRVANQ